MTKLKETPTAKELMCRHVQTVDPDATLAEITKRLLDHQISNLPVVDRATSPPLLLGFISEADCMEHIANEMFYGNPSPHLTAQHIMKRHPVCIAPDTNVFTLASIFVSHRLRHLPVVEDQKLLGIVSRRDVLRALDEYYRQLDQQKDDAKHPPDIHEIINHRFIIRN